MMYLSSALSQAIVSPIARTKQGYVCILVSKHTLMPHVLFGQFEIYLYKYVMQTHGLTYVAEDIAYLPHSYGEHVA